ncbi:MAG: arginase family protein [Solirubrobacteraceae bacterium]
MHERPVTTAVGPWEVLLAPMDCAGEHEGEERAPQALLAAGLLAAVSAESAVELDTGIAAPDRDGDTGVIGLGDLQRSSGALRAAVRASIGAGRRPLVLGGDCAIVPGVMAGARDAVDVVGLAFLDGHLDALDGVSSATGEAADMDLAILTGHGPGALDACLGRRVVIAPERIAAIGFRADAPADIAMPDGRHVNEAALVDAAVHRFDARRLRDLGAEQTAARALNALDADRRPLWLHLDVDVLDQASLPAVSYPQAGGPDWAQLEALLTALARGSDLIGAHVTCFNPDLDPEGSHARRIVGTIHRALGSPTS